MSSSQATVLGSQQEIPFGGHKSLYYNGLETANPTNHTNIRAIRAIRGGKKALLVVGEWQGSGIRHGVGTVLRLLPFPFVIFAPFMV